MTGKDKQTLLDEQLLLSAAKSTLEHNIDQIDEQVQSRLAAARQIGRASCRERV